MKEGWLGRAWRASAHPGDFFATLPDDARLGAAARPALLSLTVGASVMAFAIGRATASDAWLPILLFVVPGMILYGATLWLVGGMTLARAAALDLRGWEIAGWAWVPTGFLALSLLPVAAVFPVTSLVVGTLGLPVWHLAVVAAGLKTFSGRRPGRALLFYALVVLAVPITAMAISLLAILATGTGG
ncbi:MAG: hypothetical protein WD314_11880 [Trueperaceae bacterium]